MAPGAKRTIVTSKTNGRRYFLVRSTNRPGGRRYYVCSNPMCNMRVAREADLYCKNHAQEQTQQQNQNENVTDISKSLNESNGDDFENNNDTLNQKMDIEENTEINQNGNDDSVNDPINETTNDNSINSQTAHLTEDDENHKTRQTRKRHTAPPVIIQTKQNRFRSPFQSPITTSTVNTSLNTTNGSQSSELNTSKKRTQQRPGTTRSFRDASGKLRFLCSIPTCRSRVPRQSEYYCKRHQREMQGQEPTNTNLEISITNNEENRKEIKEVEETSKIPSQSVISETITQSDGKKRKHESSIVLSCIPSNKIVIATTTLLDDQWNDVLSFIRHFPQVQLSANLNVNNSTTHLLVDDNENHLHCTITKKIVQAAVRHHIFIISSRWVNECIRLNTFVDEHPYEIISDTHTTLRLSEQDLNPNAKYLFNQNLQCLYAFAIECRQCQGSINRSELIELIQLTGAQLFQNDQAVEILIVLCDVNDKNLDKIKEKYTNAPASNIKYVTSDFLLKSIIKFEIQDIEKYCL